jgi:small subunit ribosomal protein S17
MEQPNLETPTVTLSAAHEVRAVEGLSEARSAQSKDDARNRRRIKQGVVKSDKMDKTIVVVTETRVPHPVYKKIIRKSVRFKAHDDTNDAKVGDTVRIMETRPISKDKRWRLLEIVERAK